MAIRRPNSPSRLKNRGWQRKAPHLLASQVLLLAILAPLAGANAQIVEKTGIIPAIISESSGVATSRSYPGVFWTHNDSGHEPNLYAITADGTVMAQLSVLDARARDWEDIAVGKCPPYVVSLSGECVYLADTGDNFQRRRSVQIYVVPEPDPRSQATRTESAVRIDFRYPDGPADVEGIAIDGDGLIWLVTKGRDWPVATYTLDISAPSSPTARVPLRAIKADTLGLPRVRLSGWVSGATMSPSGERLILRTYVDIYSFLRGREGRWVPAGPACHIGAIEPQGEGIDLIDEETFVLTSEALFNRPGTIHRVRCP